VIDVASHVFPTRRPLDEQRSTPPRQKRADRGELVLALEKVRDGHRGSVSASS
jgi:hypothetical protein